MAKRDSPKRDPSSLSLLGQSLLDRAEPGYEASRRAGPASGRRKEYPERSRADSLTTIPEAPPRPALLLTKIAPEEKKDRP